MKKQKNNAGRKFLLIALGIFLSLLLIEMVLQISGLLVHLLSRNDAASDDDEYRILALGESTTADILNGQGSWPEYLEDILNNSSSHVKFRVYNEGIGGTNTAFILSRLESNIEKYHPDMVITMMGLADEKLEFIYSAGSQPGKSDFFQNLKLVKLARWIYYAFQANIRDNNVKPEHIVSQRIVDEDKEIIEAKQLAMTGFSREAISQLKGRLNQSPQNDEIYYFLGYSFVDEDDFRNASFYLEKAIEINPRNYDAKILLSVSYDELGEFEKNRNLMEALLSDSQEGNAKNRDYIYTQLGKTYRMLGKTDEELADFYRKHGFGLPEARISQNITRYHYNLMYDILNAKGIRYAAMQYPTLRISELKAFFNESDDILFISNQENLDDALMSHNYSDIFLDHAGATFGHATRYGNMLIASEAASAIMNYLNISDQ